MLKKISHVLKKDNISEIFNDSITFKLTTEEQKFLSVLGKQDLQTIIKFMIQSFYAEMDTLYTELSEIKENDFINDISLIRQAKYACETKYNSKEDHVDALKRSYKDLTIGLDRLFQKSKKYIDTIKDIDRTSEIEKKIHWNTFYSRVKINNYLARRSFETIMYGISLAKIIADKLKWDISNSLLLEYKTYLQLLLDGNTCNILYNYEEEHSNFWLEAPKNALDMLENDSLDTNFSHNHQNDDIDFDNMDIEF